MNHPSIALPKHEAQRLQIEQQQAAVANTFRLQIAAGCLAGLARIRVNPPDAVTIALQYADELLERLGIIQRRDGPTGPTSFAANGGQQDGAKETETDRPSSGNGPG